MKLIDAHCHFHAYQEEECRKFKYITIVAVSDDYKSSIKTCELSKKFKNINPFIGIHPWNINNLVDEELRLLKEFLENQRCIAGIGEVGLDFKFSKAPIYLQLKIYEKFCKIAAEKNLPLNVHSYSAWKEAMIYATRNDVPSVLFHWYNGPEGLLKEIKDNGYFISINPACAIQSKHRNIVEKASEDIILTESDGPYVYRNIHLNSSKIIQILEIISKVKKISLEDASQIVATNYDRYMMRL